MSAPRRGWGRSLLVSAALGLAAGLTVGLLRGLGWALDGFPRLLPHELATAGRAGLAGGVVFGLLYTIVGAAAGRFAASADGPHPTRRPRWLGVAVATLPFLLLAGYHWNRGQAIRPADLLTARGALPNLLLVLAVAAGAILVGFLLARAEALAGRARWRDGLALTLALVLVAAELGRLAALHAPPPAAPPVLILLVDALRADHLGSYGYERDTSPAIDSLARDGVRFANTIAASTFTKTSVASLLTGRHPHQHGVYWGGREGDRVVSDVLPSGETTLAEVLRERGYLTTAWVQNSQLAAVMGFGQGFHAYRDQLGAIEQIHHRLLPWLAGPAGVAPIFAYVHYIDLHDPYLPPAPYDTRFGNGPYPYAGVDLDEWGQFLRAVREGRETLSAERVARLRDLYDGQLRRVDDGIARLLEVLRRSGLYDRSLIVLTSDHGDGLMEHGFIGHSTTPYEELVRVPLIVKLPGGRHAGTVVEEQVRHVDLLPTVLGALGISPPPRVAGCNLMPLVRGAAAAPGARTDMPPRAADCAIAITEIAQPDRSLTVALRTPQWKYIAHAARPPELYDLRADPGERHNLAAQRSAEAAPLAALAADIRQRRGTSEQVELDADLEAQLRALGYVD